jgi:hypothetical protein
MIDGTLRIDSEFPSFKAFEDWLAEEEKAWHWLSEVQWTGRYQGLPSPWGGYGNLFSQLRQQLEQTRDGSTDEQMQAAIVAIQSRASQAYSQGKAMWSGDPRARLVFRMKDTDVEKFAAVLSVYQNPEVDTRQGFKLRHFEVMSLAALFASTLAPDGVLGDLDALRKERDAIAALRRSMEETHGDYAKDIAARRTELAQLRAEEEKTFNDMRGEAGGALDNLTKTYEQHMALRAPVTYWSEKSKRHRNGAIASAAAFAVLTVLIGWAFIQEAQWLLHPHPTELASAPSHGEGGADTRTAQSVSEPAQPVPAPGTLLDDLRLIATGLHGIGGYAVLVVLAASFGFMVWPLRLLARIFLSSIHLRADADERATIANTYLSLVSTGEALGKEERDTLLTALFRHSATGVVHDEGPSFNAVVDLFRRNGP